MKAVKLEDVERSCMSVSGRGQKGSGGVEEWRNGGGSAAQVSSIFFFFFHSELSYCVLGLNTAELFFSLGEIRLFRPVVHLKNLDRRFH